MWSPSCGKTTVGRLVAEKTGKTFVDLDGKLKREGRTIPDIFTEAGEEYFRKVESEVAREVLSGGGQVVSTGGGTPVAEKIVTKSAKTVSSYILRARSIGLSRTDVGK
ncbi:MAG: shikimate kinase [Christensenellales bacterium]